jgi:DNA-binding NarL/FixJ family response regulator
VDETMKILLVDDHALFRVGLRMLLATVGDDVSVIETATVSEALEVLEAQADVQLCLLDLALKAESGLAAIARIKTAAPKVSIVVVSGVDDNATIRRCIDAGAMSFVPKRVPPEMLTQALKEVLAGTIYLPQTIFDAASESTPRPTLTPRQTEVLRCLSRGLPTKLIARELALSEHTVKEHISSIFQALGARNRTAAVIHASRLHLLPTLGGGEPPQ